MREGGRCEYGDEQTIITQHGVNLETTKSIQAETPGPGELSFRDRSVPYICHFDDVNWFLGPVTEDHGHT